MSEYLRQCLPYAVADEVIAGISGLPGHLARLASDSNKYFRLPGPFPIRHPDLSLNNIIVASDFAVRGVIDWEGATTVPWELVDAPTATGLPRDRDEAGRWAGHATCVDMMREAEADDAGLDHRLSDVLADPDLQDLAALMHPFALGKMGYYGRAMDIHASAP
ncbi:hypothetical protein N0V85_008510 [Neurospora sp. IMI 360204]|nr:hypothetical protein N0V85_008510 [Neurospora sp. IMI 360204]